MWSIEVAEKREHRRGKKYLAYDLNTKEKIVKMLDDGARNCDIVRALNVPESTVRRLRKRKVEVKSQCASVVVAIEATPTATPIPSQPSISSLYNQ